MTTQSEWVKDVTEADFQAEVIERSRQLPVVVDFWAPWCGPCRALGPVLERLAEKRQGQFVLAKVNTDECQELAGAFGIQAIPAVKAIRDGAVVLEFEGVLPENALEDFIDRICPTEADHLSEEAQKLEASDPQGAERLYRQALAGTRPPTVAHLGLARLLLARGEEQEAANQLGLLPPGTEQNEVDRLSGILALRELSRSLPGEDVARKVLEADPENAEAHYHLGVALAAAGRHSEALETFLAAAERDKKLGSGVVREAMLKVFQVVGVRSDLADGARNRLRSLLY